MLFTWILWYVSDIMAIRRLINTTVVTNMYRPNTSWNKYEREAGFPGVMFMSLSLITEILLNKRIEQKHAITCPFQTVKRTVLVKHVRVVSILDEKTSCILVHNEDIG